MHMRSWLAASGVLLAVVAVPVVADASVGVGIQAGPVRLAGAAHPGGSYALPAVYVVNTGTQDEYVVLSVQRVSAGRGRTVPPSWIHLSGTGVRLSHSQGARIPLELDVPANAKPGAYFSDVIAKGSSATAPGSASLGVAAATKLEFSVAPGIAPGSWLRMPVWLVAVLVAVLMIGAALFVLRRTGWRIRIERDVSRAEVTSAGPTMLRSSRLLALLVLVALAGCGIGAASIQGAGKSGKISLTLNTVPTFRSVKVSPGYATFGDCHRGSAYRNTRSSATKLGYPNGRCWFGSQNGSFPILITNTGIAANIDVYGANATPSDGSTGWTLCNVGPDPAVACIGNADHSLPGTDQYLVRNFSPAGRPDVSGLTTNPQCDHQFGGARGCFARQGASRIEGIELIGPYMTTDTSTKWTVTITWMPVP